MPASKINLSQMVDLAVGTPEVGAVNANVLHTLLHAMLRQLNIVDVQADLNDIDRDVLSASKARELSVLSDVDGGRGDDARSESSSSIPAPKKRTPYQFLNSLKVKGAKLQEKLKRIRSVPSIANNHPLEKTRTKSKKKPNGDVLLNMQLVNQVDTNDNEKEIVKLNIDDLMKRLNAMEKSMNEMNERFNTLPSHDDFAKIVTRAELEDTLQGIRQDCRNLQQPTERVVIEMSTQTDPVPSRPTSSHSVTHGKLLDKVVVSHGKMLDNIVESHEALTICVKDLETEMGKKLDQGVLDGLNVSSEIIEQLQELKEQVGALGAAREWISEPLELLDSPPSTRFVTSNDDLKEMQAADITSLEMKVSMLQNQLYQIQDTINPDDSTRWEISRGTPYEEAISLIFTENEPDKTRKLASAVNDQLHDIRDAFYALDKKLMKKATVQTESEPVEILLERTNSADFKDTDLDALLKSQNENREEIERVFACYKELMLSKANRTEVHQKADKRALVAVNSLIERKTNDILNKMAVNEDNWNEQCQIFSDNINKKLDREELEPLKEALGDKLKKENQAPVEWVDDDNAAGIRSDTSKSTSITEKQKAKMAESDQNALKVHFGNDDETLQKQRNASNDYANADNNAKNRSCDEQLQHTTTNPHKCFPKRPHLRSDVYSMTKLSHLSNVIIKEDEETDIYPLCKEEVLQGVDGIIYKGRMVRVETKLPPVTQATQDPSSMQRKDKSPHQMRHKVMREARPSSSKMLHTPRPPPKNGSLPTLKCY